MAYQLVIFDMDGTLTEELLNFAAIRADIGLPPDLPILEQISHLAPDARARAEAILERHEMMAAAACRLHDGAVEVLETLGQRGVKTALLTRNSARCAQTVLGRHAIAGHLSYVATREDPPFKPHPDSILNITRRLGIAPAQTLMVGDYLYDLQAAAAAGVDSALLWVRSGTLPAFAVQATYVLKSLRDLLPLVRADQTHASR